MKKNTSTIFLSLIMTLVSINSFGQDNQIRQSQKSSVTQYVGADTPLIIAVLQ